MIYCMYSKYRPPLLLVSQVVFVLLDSQLRYEVVLSLYIYKVPHVRLRLEIPTLNVPYYKLHLSRNDHNLCSIPKIFCHILRILETQ